MDKFINRNFDLQIIRISGETFQCLDVVGTEVPRCSKCPEIDGILVDCHSLAVLGSTKSPVLD